MTPCAADPVAPGAEVTTEVLDHAAQAARDAAVELTPAMRRRGMMNVMDSSSAGVSFDGVTDDNSETVNFGNYTGGVLPTQNIEVHNLPTNGNTTYTVDMRYDVGTATGDSGQFDLSNIVTAEDITFVLAANAIAARE